MTQTFLTVEQIVTMLNVHEQTVRRWLKTGELKGINFGGKTGWRIAEEDFRDFIARRKAASTPDDTQGKAAA